MSNPSRSIPALARNFERKIIMQQLAQKLIATAQDRGGIANIYLIGCGGSLGALYPAKKFVDTEAVHTECIQINSNEFVHTPQAKLGPRSVAMVVSHQGNTPETVEAARVAREAGAQVVAFTYKEGDSPLAQQADHVVRYTWGDDHDISCEKTMLVLRLCCELVHGIEGYRNYHAFCQGVEKIDQLTKQALATSKDQAVEFSQNYKDDPFLYVMGSGAAFGAAYMESICIFMEMQWINSSAIHTGEFFHGPFEVTDENTPFILQISCGTTRELDLRALRFLESHAKRFITIDAKSLGLDAIDIRVVDYFEHSFFTNVYNIYNEFLAQARNHPLSTRRYMWKISY